MIQGRWVAVSKREVWEPGGPDAGPDGRLPVGRGGLTSEDRVGGTVSPKA